MDSLRTVRTAFMQWAIAEQIATPDPTDRTLYQLPERTRLYPDWLGTDAEEEAESARYTCYLQALCLSLLPLREEGE